MTQPMVPPSDLVAERAVLGAALLDRESWLAACDVLQPNDFYADKHAVIWNSLVAAEAESGAVDTTLLRGQLALSGGLERVGGDEYLLSLTDTIPTVSNVERYAERIRDLATVRRVIQAAYLIAAQGYGHIDSLGDYLDSAEVAIGKACERRTGNAISKTIGVVVEEAFEEVLKRAESADHILGFATGYKLLDFYMSGMQRGALTIVAGRPGMGKTAFAFGLTTGVAHSSKEPSLFFSLEMPSKELGQRALSSEACIDLQRLRRAKLNREDWEPLTKAAGELMDLPIELIDESTMSILDIRRETRRFKRRHGKLAMVVVDYLQLIKSHEGAESREQAVSMISRSLKALAKQEDVAVLALAQLNRGAETRGAKDRRPQLSDLRESGAIEQDADNVVFLYRDEVYNADSEDKGIAEIIIAKQRSGPTGTVRMAFKREYTRFENLEERFENDERERW